MEPWEALDLDDSDITSSSSSSFSLLRRCTFQPPPQQQPPPPSQTPIPGPAGAVQSAMHRKTRPGNAESAEISTQEYIRRVEEDDGEEFSRDPWIRALDGLVDVTPLRDVKKCMSFERIDKVVAIVKSCKLNGLGDMMVTLKDPTDTVGASVHRKVLNSGECEKLIVVGSVLILEKVVAFYSSCASCYLSITRSNVVKIISADGDVQSFPEASACPSASKDDLPPILSFGEDLEIPEKTSGLIHRRPEARLRDDRPGHISKGKAVAEYLTGKDNSTQTINLISGKIPKEPIHMNSINAGLNTDGLISKLRNKSLRSTQPGLGITSDFANQIHEDLDNAEKQRQVREFSSAPIIGENIHSRFSWKPIGATMGSQSRGGSNYTACEKIDVQVNTPTGTPNDLDNSSREENLDDIDISRGNVKIRKPNDPQKRRQPTETVREAEETNSGKKQRQELVSQTSVQEWTDEQLDIFDMDED